MQKQHNIPIYIAAILLCFTLISVHLSSGLYAKYISAYSSADSASVARFQINDNDLSFSKDVVFSLQPGVFETSIEIENNSEVAVACDLTIENVTQNIPLEFQIENAAASSIKHNSICNMAANSKENFKLTIKWDQSDAIKYIGMVDLLRITINAEQID